MWWQFSAWSLLVLRWMRQNTFGDKSTLVQVMAWCHQAPSHYLSQCWPRSVPPYDVTRPQWVNRVICFEEIQICTCIVCHSWILKNLSCSKIILENDKNILKLWSQYYTCWWPGAARTATVLVWHGFFLEHSGQCMIKLLPLYVGLLWRKINMFAFCDS